jgi:hypothetical protein
MPTLLTPAETNVDLHLENGNDKALSTIQQMGSDNANVSLGFRMTPSGTQKPEIKFCIGQSDKITARLQSSRLTPKDSWVLYSAIYNAKIFFQQKFPPTPLSTGRALHREPSWLSSLRWDLTVI